MPEARYSREHILNEIQRLTATNGANPPGRERFEDATGIRQHEWQGRYWSRWSDALEEAGVQTAPRIPVPDTPSEPMNMRLLPPSNPHAFAYTFAATVVSIALLTPIILTAPAAAGTAGRIGAATATATLPAAVTWLVARKASRRWAWWAYPGCILAGSLVLVAISLPLKTQRTPSAHTPTAPADTNSASSHRARREYRIVAPRRLAGFVKVHDAQTRLASKETASRFRRLAGSAATPLMASYGTASNGTGGVSFILVGLNGKPGGQFYRQSQSPARDLHAFVAGTGMRRISYRPATNGRPALGCGEFTQSPPPRRACAWTARGTSAIVTFHNAPSLRAAARLTWSIAAEVLRPRSTR